MFVSDTYERHETRSEAIGSLLGGESLVDLAGIYSEGEVAEIDATVDERDS